jgi:hypothetical protein
LTKKHKQIIISGKGGETMSRSNGSNGATPKKRIKKSERATPMTKYQEIIQQDRRQRQEALQQEISTGRLDPAKR